MGYAEYLGAAEGLKAAEPWLIKALLRPEEARLKERERVSDLYKTLIQRGELRYAEPRLTDYLGAPQAGVPTGPAEVQERYPTVAEILGGQREVEAGKWPQNLIYRPSAATSVFGAPWTPEEQGFISEAYGYTGKIPAPRRGLGGVITGGLAAAERRARMIKTSEIQAKKEEYDKTKDLTGIRKWVDERVMEEQAVVPAAMPQLLADPVRLKEFNDRKEQLLQEITGGQSQTSEPKKSEWEKYLNP